MIAEPVPRSRPPQHGKDRDYLSFSAIRTYQACPLRYYFRYIAGLPEKTVSASLVFGAAIHRAIEHHFRQILAGEGSPPLPELFEHYRAEWRERDPATIRAVNDEKSQSLDELAGRVLQTFRESAAAEPGGMILAIEEELRAAVIPGLPDLLGRVDMVIETPAELIVRDWKTSRSRWSTEQLEEATEQLMLYSELVRDFAPGKAVRLEFDVLTKTKEVAIATHAAPVNSRQVTRMKRVVEKVWRAIDAQHFYPAPTPLACGGCPFRDPCRRWPA